MKQKTQMQYLIADLIDRAKTDDTISINLVIGLAVVRLEKEKQQIINAYEKGTDEGINDGGEDSENYYNSNFGDEVAQAGI